MSHRGVEVVQGIDAIARTGLSFDKVGPNELVARMPLQGNANHAGILYAGSLFSLAECAAGVLFLNRFGDREVVPICGGVNIRFRRPATSDITLTLSISDEEFEGLHARALAEGKAAIEFEEKLVDTNDEIVSIAKVSYVLLKV